MKIEKLKKTIRVRSYHSDTGEEEVKVKNYPLVRFSSHERPFLMIEKQCHNPDCDCNETVLSFNEIAEAGAPIKHPINFNISLDHFIWEEKRKPMRSKKVQALVDEFISDLSDETKSKFKETYDNMKAELHDIAKFEMPIERVHEGYYVSHTAVFGGKGSILSGGTGVSFIVEYNGEKIYIDDQYCINPMCECEAVRLIFMKIIEGVVHHLFSIRVPFNNEIEIDDKLTRYTKEEIKIIFDYWLKSDPPIMNILEGRYRTMKGVGQNLVERNISKKLPEHTTGVGQKKTGRNDPCPCGSGKKYKKCCGKSK